MSTLHRKAGSMKLSVHEYDLIIGLLSKFFRRQLTIHSKAAGTALMGLFDGMWHSYNEHELCRYYRFSYCATNNYSRINCPLRIKVLEDKSE